MKRIRRSYEEIESSIVAALKKFGGTGASISQISMEAKINWRTTNSILERLRKWGVVELQVQDKKLKVYKWAR
jgi:predicted transcriptional regulator